MIEEFAPPATALALPRHDGYGHAWGDYVYEVCGSCRADGWVDPSCLHCIQGYRIWTLDPGEEIPESSRTYRSLGALVGDHWAEVDWEAVPVGDLKALRDRGVDPERDPSALGPKGARSRLLDRLALA